MVALELPVQMFRVMGVDQHERLSHGEGVETSEDQRVALRLGDRAHIQLLTVPRGRSSIDGRGLGHALILFSQSLIV